MMMAGRKGLACLTFISYIYLIFIIFLFSILFLTTFFHVFYLPDFLPEAMLPQAASSGFTHFQPPLL